MDWTLLPQGPLSLISELLQSEIDVVRFRSVCTSWRSAVPRRQSPWFLASSYGESECFALFAFPGTRIPNVPEFFRPHPYCGSFGWIGDPNGSITHGQPITLYNPITMDRIDLPGINCFDQNGLFFLRLILSSDPATTSDYTAATYWEGKLAIYRAGDEAWSATPFPGPIGFLFDTYAMGDFAFYRGLIYISQAARIFVFDPAAEVKLVQTIPVPCVGWCPDSGEAGCGCWRLSSYLVESCGDLLLVRKDHLRFHNKKFEVHKLQFCGGGLPQMVKMESLGDRALFIAHGCSFSLSATKFPEYKGNHIYFGYSDDYGSMVLAFNLADGTDELATPALQDWSDPALEDWSDSWRFSRWFRPHLP